MQGVDDEEANPDAAGGSQSRQNRIPDEESPESAAVWPTTWPLSLSMQT